MSEMSEEDPQKRPLDSRGAPLPRNIYWMFSRYIHHGEIPSKDMLVVSGFYTPGAKAKYSHKRMANKALIRFMLWARKMGRGLDSRLVLAGSNKKIIPAEDHPDLVMYVHTRGGADGVSHRGFNNTIRALQLHYAVGHRQFGITDQVVRKTITRCGDPNCLSRISKDRLAAIKSKCTYGNDEDEPVTDDTDNQININNEEGRQEQTFVDLTELSGSENEDPLRTSKPAKRVKHEGDHATHSLDGDISMKTESFDVDPALPTTEALAKLLNFKYHDVSEDELQQQMKSGRKYTASHQESAIHKKRFAKKLTKKFGVGSRRRSITATWTNSSIAPVDISQGLAGISDIMQASKFAPPSYFPVDGDAASKHLHKNPDMKAPRKGNRKIKDTIITISDDDDNDDDDDDDDDNLDESLSRDGENDQNEIIFTGVQPAAPENVNIPLPEDSSLPTKVMVSVPSAGVAGVANIEPVAYEKPVLSPPLLTFQGSNAMIRMQKDFQQVEGFAGVNMMGSMPSFQPQGSQPVGLLAGSHNPLTNARVIPTGSSCYPPQPASHPHVDVQAINISTLIRNVQQLTKHATGQPPPRMGPDEQFTTLYRIRPDGKTEVHYIPAGKEQDAIRHGFQQSGCPMATYIISAQTTAETKSTQSLLPSTPASTQIISMNHPTLVSPKGSPIEIIPDKESSPVSNPTDTVSGEVDVTIPDSTTRSESKSFSPDETASNATCLINLTHSDSESTIEIDDIPDSTESPTASPRPCSPESIGFPELSNSLHEQEVEDLDGGEEDSTFDQKYERLLQCIDKFRKVMRPVMSGLKSPQGALLPRLDHATSIVEELRGMLEREDDSASES